MSFSFFISHRRSLWENDDLFQDFIAELGAKLASLVGEPAEGIVFRDAGSIENGTPDYRRSLIAALNSSLVFVPVLTTNYFESEACGREWAVAEYRDKNSRIFYPILWHSRQQMSGRIPEKLQFRQFAQDLRDSSLEPGLSSLYVSADKEGRKQIIHDVAEALYARYIEVKESDRRKRLYKGKWDRIKPTFPETSTGNVGSAWRSLLPVSAIATIFLIILVLWVSAPKRGDWLTAVVVGEQPVIWVSGTTPTLDEGIFVQFLSADGKPVVRSKALNPEDVNRARERGESIFLRYEGGEFTDYRLIRTATLQSESGEIISDEKEVTYDEDLDHV